MISMSNGLPKYCVVLCAFGACLTIRFQPQWIRAIDYNRMLSLCTAEKKRFVSLRLTQIYFWFRRFVSVLKPFPHTFKCEAIKWNKNTMFFLCVKHELNRFENCFARHFPRFFMCQPRSQLIQKIYGNKWKWIDFSSINWMTLFTWVIEYESILIKMHTAAINFWFNSCRWKRHLQSEMGIWLAVVSSKQQLSTFHSEKIWNICFSRWLPVVLLLFCVSRSVSQRLTELHET